MEAAANLLETLLNLYQSARRYIPEDGYVGSHCSRAGPRYVDLGQGRLTFF
jgi:hypothetical protein